MAQESNLSEGIIEDLVNAVNGRLDNIVTVQDYLGPETELKI